ncbi:MerR family transcriptional regulator [Nocardia sp. 2]|uniref:MerR family transcriptional regulator n=1 Tax=Nocardia acididurans TaxID=2802282 RepID=A0ABS1MGU8_9NOCA|nr:MerR family transcriptional regulator [Nocardia acididurans]MBL1079792.1 MerR family transcriptional regulator [Nocardia acididurans]
MATAEYTIDELAREAGTTVRSLRVYHERGVLPPPQVKGRTGYYGHDHLARVRTIGRLLERGIKLNGIRELLEAWDRGDDLGDVLGVSDSEGTPTQAPTADGTISAVDLQERFDDVPNALARVVALGLYEPLDATTYRLADWQLVRSLDQLIAIGVSATEAITEIERLSADCDRVAHRFFDLLRRTVWETYRASDHTPADRAALIDQLDRARTIPGQLAADITTRLVTRSFDLDTELAEAVSDS